MPTLNIGADTDDWRSRDLSNFPPAPFEVDGIRFASPEGAVQGIKFPYGDPRREQTFALSGKQAKRMSRVAAHEFGHRFVWWNNEAIKYRSEAHRALIERFIRACFGQNEFKRKALVATRGLTLIHSLGRPENPATCLPSEEFVAILTQIREELLLPKAEAVIAQLREQLGRESHDYAAVLLGAVQAAQIWKRLNSRHFIWSFYSVTDVIDKIEKQKSNTKRLVVHTHSPLGSVAFEYLRPLASAGRLHQLVPIGRQLFLAFLAEELDPRGIVCNGSDRTREKVLAGVWQKVVAAVVEIAEAGPVGRVGVIAALQAPWLDAPIVHEDEIEYFGLTHPFVV